MANSELKLDKSLHHHKIFDLSSANMEQEIDKILTDLLFQIKMNGFRKITKDDLKKTDSKTQNMIAKRKDIILNQQKGYVLSNAKQKYVDNMMQKELSQHDNILNISTEVKDEQFHLYYDTYKDIKISGFDKITVPSFKLKDIDKTVDAEIKRLEAKSFELTDKTTKIGKSDNVTSKVEFIDFHEDKEDKVISTLMFDTISSDFFTESEMLKHKKGDSFEKDLKITKKLSDNHAFLKDFKNVKLKITILTVKTKKMIPLDDAQIQTLYNFNSLQDLKETIKSNNTKQFDQLKQYVLEDQIFSSLKVSGLVSENMLQKCKKDIIKQTLSQSKSVKVDELALKKVKDTIILEHFKKEFKIQLNNQDIISFLSNTRDPKVIEQYQQNDEYRQNINNIIINMKIVQKMISECKQGKEETKSIEEMNKKIKDIENRYTKPITSAKTETVSDTNKKTKSAK